MNMTSIAEEEDAAAPGLEKPRHHRPISPSGSRARRTRRTTRCRRSGGRPAAPAFKKATALMILIGCCALAPPHRTLLFAYAAEPAEAEAEVEVEAAAAEEEEEARGLAAAGTKGRNWTALVDDWNIGWNANIDRRRYLQKFELDPFGDYDALSDELEKEKEEKKRSEEPTDVPSPKPTAEPAEGPTTPRPTDKPTTRPTPRPTPRPSPQPTPGPTNKPTSRPVPAWVKPSPTPRPTSRPTSRPTIAPTTRHAIKDGLHSGCPDDQYLFGLIKYDAGGDGWDEAVLTMYYDDVWTTKFAYKGTLDYGPQGVDYVCLPIYKCITVFIKGGTWTSEIKWELKSAIVGRVGVFREAFARGLAPEKCQFSFVPDFQDEVCENTCTDWNRDELKPIPGVKTLSPVAAPTKRPTRKPTTKPTAEPSASPTESPVESTLSPTEQPTAEPTISDDWGRRKLGGKARRMLKRALRRAKERRAGSDEER